MPKWVVGLIAAALAGIIGFACGGMLYRAKGKSAQQRTNKLKNDLQLEREKWQHEIKVAGAKFEIEHENVIKTKAVLQKNLIEYNKEISRLNIKLEDRKKYLLTYSYKITTNNL